MFVCMHGVSVVIVQQWTRLLSLFVEELFIIVWTHYIYRDTGCALSYSLLHTVSKLLKLIWNPAGLITELQRHLQEAV